MTDFFRLYFRSFFVCLALAVLYNVSLYIDVATTCTMYICLSVYALLTYSFGPKILHVTVQNGGLPCCVRVVSFCCVPDDRRQRDLGPPRYPAPESCKVIINN